MTSYATPAQVAKGRKLLQELNGSTAPSAAPPVTVVMHRQSGGQIAEVLADLARVKAVFQLRTVLTVMGVNPDLALTGLGAKGQGAADESARSQGAARD